MRTPLLAAILSLSVPLSLASARAATPPPGAPPADASPLPVGFQAGEGLTYKLSVGMIEAGRARMSVGAPERIHGRRRVAVHGEAHSADWLRVIARLDDDYRCVLDVDAVVTSSMHSHETGIRERRIDAEMDGRKLKLDLVAPGRDEHYKRELPSAPRDPVAALFALRAAPLRDGDVIEVLALDGAALYRARARVAGREKLAWGGGAQKVDAIRVDIEATRIYDNGAPVPMKQRHMKMWLSDDARRVPYLMEGETDLGEARLELTSYVPGEAVAADSLGAAPTVTAASLPQVTPVAARAGLRRAPRTDSRLVRRGVSAR